MCRLFGLHAGSNSVPATFWLLDAPDSLQAQSHRNPDGAGIGVFGPGGRPTIAKQPIAAWQDAEFATAAQQLRGTTFVAHVRYATTGAHTVANTHPFLLQSRMFAHNGVVQGLTELDRRLADLGDRDLVAGDTDSERIFALITGEIGRLGGDVGAGIVAAIGWITEHLPTYSVNFVLTTATDLWALRYPSTNPLYVLDRPAGTGELQARTDRIHAYSGALADTRAVIIATEKMDDHVGWRLLEPGELLRVDADLRVESRQPFAPTPRHLLDRADLGLPAVGSQHEGVHRD